MADRIKLQVIEVSEPKEVGQKGAKKLSFKAKDSEGKELSYFTFRTSLFDTIKVGTEIDVEIEVKTRDVDGNIYTDRQVNQIFIGGQPVGGQRNQWQGRGDNPEQRASIETQVAVKTIAELRIAEKLSENSPEYKAMLGWCKARLNIKEGKVVVAQPETLQELGSPSSSKGKPKATKALAPEPKVIEQPPIEEATSPSVDQQFDQLGEGQSPAKVPEVQKQTQTEQPQLPVAPPKTPLELFDRVTEKMKWHTSTYARTWLVNYCGINEKDIDEHPDAVWKAVCEQREWTL